jgi:RimJ/RimL family protein N-acetyltransferase
MTPTIRLRPVIPSDLPIFFQYEQDLDARHMAAFTSKDADDEEAFMARWDRILADEAVIARTILVGDQVAGSVSKHEAFGVPEVTYWLGRPFWGQGIATAALSQLLDLLPTRPLHARVAKDNIASLRVLQKCGFTITGEDRGYANARGAETEEYLLTLE